MQCVILAAGKGTRMRPLTNDRPKPMVELLGKPLLEHIFEQLPSQVKEFIVVIGYRGDQIRDYFGTEWRDRKITYITQKKQQGTADAVLLAKPYLKDRFLVVMGDDLFSSGDIEQCMATSDWGLVIMPTDTMGAGGSIVLDEEGLVASISEGDHRGKPGIMNTNIHLLDVRFFDYPMVPKSAGSSEYGLPQTAMAVSKAAGIPFRPHNAKWWFQVTAPEDIQRAEAILKGEENIPCRV